MQAFKSTLLSRWLEYTLTAMIPFAGLLTLTLPWSITIITNRLPSWKLDDPASQLYMYEKYFLVLLVSGVVAMTILWQARRIMRIVNRGNPFVMDLVRRMRLIGALCLFLSVFYFAAVFVVTKFFMVVVFVAFVIIGLVMFVFSELFRQAIIYKEENDMTI